MPKEYDDTLDDTVLITHDPETGRPISNDTAVSEPTSTRGRARSKETVPLAPERDRPSDNSDDDDARRQRRVRQQQFREQRTSATYGRVRFFGIVCFVFGLTPLGIGIYSLVSVEEDRRHNWREQTCEIVPSTLTHDHCVFYTLRHKSEESCGIVAHFATHGGWNTAPGCRDANYDDFPSIKYWRELSVAGNGTTTPCWVPKHTIDPKTCAIAAVREKSLSNFLWDNNEHFVFVSRNPE